MYEIYNQGKLLCVLSDKVGITTPQFLIGEYITIGGIRFVIVDKEIAIQINPLNNPQGNIQKVKIKVAESQNNY